MSFRDYMNAMADIVLDHDGVVDKFIGDAVMAGSLGSDKRIDYTIIGDRVNVSARLESYDKSLKVISYWLVVISYSLLVVGCWVGENCQKTDRRSLVAVV